MKKAREKRERIVRKKGWAKIGIFIFGLFFGILFTLGSLVGVGFWAYKNLTLQKIEKLTNSTIDVGNESIKKITIEDVVSNISGITSDKNYTIAKLENDFGITVVGENGFIPNELYGLDLTPLKQCTLKTLDDGIEDILGNANINTFLSFLEQSDEDLGMFANILNTNIDYYYDSITDKLYEEKNFQTLVKFDYEINDNIVSLGSDKDTTYTITNNKISVPFRRVALESAFGSFDKVTNNLKIYEILDYHYNKNDKKYYEDENYTKPLTGFMKILATKSIDDLSSSSFFDNLKLHEVFGYYYDGTNYYNYYDGTTYTEQVTLKGIEKALAQKSVDDLTSDGAFDDVYIYDVLNLHLNADGKYCEEGSNTPVTGVLNAIAGKTIGSLSDHEAFNDIYIYEVMNYTQSEVSEGVYTYTDSEGNTVTGVMKTLAGSKVNNIESTIKTITLGDALDVSIDDASGVIKTFYSTEIGQLNSVLDPNSLYIYQALGYTRSGTEGNYSYTDNEGYPVTGIMATLAGSTVNNIESTIKTVKLGDALGITEAEASGVIKTFYSTEIGQLNSALNPDTLQVYKAMGYTYENNKYYEIKNGVKTEVTGIMATLAGATLNNISDEINNIKVSDIITDDDSPILKLYSSTELDTLTIKEFLISDNTDSNYSKGVISRINTANIETLVRIGIITGISETDLNDTIKTLTIPGLIAYIININGNN